MRPTSAEMQLFKIMRRTSQEGILGQSLANSQYKIKNIKSRNTLCLSCLPDYEEIVETDIRKVSCYWYDPNNERPAESGATNGEPFVEVVCTALNGFQDFSISR
jgi:hypothetical protein